MIRSTGVIKIILFSSIGFLLVPLIIKLNIIQYSSLPAKVDVRIVDGRTNKPVIFSLPVRSKLKIDSASKVSTSDSSIILNQVLFQENPAFFVWMILITIMLTIASGAFPVFLRERQLLITRFKIRKQQSLIAFFSFLGVTTLLMITNIYLPGYLRPPVIIDEFHILLTHGFFLKGIEILTILLMAPAIVVMFLVGVAAGNININKSSPQDVEKDLRLKIIRQNIQAGIEDFNYLNQTLRNALQVIAIVVVFSILDSSALGRSVNSTMQIKGLDIYPSEISYVYGLFFSMFLSIIYLPVFYTVKNMYAELKKDISKILADEDMQDVKEMQDAYSSFKLESSGLNDLKVSLTVLAPLISAFLPAYLHI